MLWDGYSDMIPEDTAIVIQVILDQLLEADSDIKGVLYINVIVCIHIPVYVRSLI